MPITTKVETIDPVTARAWLKANTRNRPLRPRRVAELADAIRRGEWRFDGSPVRFAADGTLLDGQHRLKAISEAGIAVSALVVRGIDADAQLVMDTGARRTFADHLKIGGETYHLVLAAACHVMWKWENGVFVKRTRDTATFGQLADVLERHPDLRVCAQAAAVQARRVRMAPGYLAAARHLLIGIHREDADYFFARLVDGANLCEGDSIRHLRETLHQNFTARTKYPPEHLFAMTIKAWNYYRDGRAIKQLGFRSGGAAPEAFPEPR